MKTDSEIRQDVIDQLKYEPMLNAAEIGVAVKNGIVTLSGIVDSYFKKIAAEMATKKSSRCKRNCRRFTNRHLAFFSQD